MRQRQPDGAKLKKARRSRIKDPARNVDVRDGVAIKKDGALMVIKNQSANRKCGRYCGEQQVVTERTSVHSYDCCSLLIKTGIGRESTRSYANRIKNIRMLLMHSRLSIFKLLSPRSFLIRVYSRNSRLMFAMAGLRLCLLALAQVFIQQQRQLLPRSRRNLIFVGLDGKLHR